MLEIYDSAGTRYTEDEIRAIHAELQRRLKEAVPVAHCSRYALHRVAKNDGVLRTIGFDEKLSLDRTSVYDVALYTEPHPLYEAKLQRYVAVSVQHDDGERTVELNPNDYGKLVLHADIQALTTPDLSKLPRYDLMAGRSPSWDDCELYSTKSEDGEWVKFADVQALLQGEKP